MMTVEGRGSILRDLPHCERGALQLATTQGGWWGGKRSASFYRYRRGCDKFTSAFDATRRSVTIRPHKQMARHGYHRGR
jgi:hypothetical protein